jgi:hypothetical protein
MVVPVEPDGTAFGREDAAIVASIYLKGDPDWLSRQIEKGQLFFARDGAPVRPRSSIGSDSRRRPPKATSG